MYTFIYKICKTHVSCLFNLCVHVCVHMYSVLYVGTWTLYCVLRQKIDIIVCLGWSPTYVLRHRLCLKLDAYQSARLNGNKLWGSNCLCLPKARITDVYYSVWLFSFQYRHWRFNSALYEWAVSSLLVILFQQCSLIV